VENVGAVVKKEGKTLSATMPACAVFKAQE